MSVNIGSKATVEGTHHAKEVLTLGNAAEEVGLSENVGGSDAIARGPAAIAGIATAAEGTYSAMKLWTHRALHHATAFFTRGKKVDESADSITHNKGNDIVNENICAKLVLNEDSDNKSIIRVIPNANNERYKPLFTDSKYLNQPPGKRKRSFIPSVDVVNLN